MVKKSDARKRKFVQSKPYKDTSTPSIYKFFRPTHSKRAKRATDMINSAEKKAPSVGISWRPDGSGKFLKCSKASNDRSILYLSSFPGVKFSKCDYTLEGFVGKKLVEVELRAAILSVEHHP